VKFAPALTVVVAALMAAASPRAVAADGAGPGLQWSGSGFATLAAGKVLGGTSDPATDYGYRCPCMITDYAQGAIYEKGGWSLRPDSVLGLQGTVRLGESGVSATGQVVARGARDGRTNLEWLYLDWQANSSLTLQLGRKRLPLLAQSEVQDVGYAVPWVHLPPQVYGWEVVNYNGVNALYRGRWGDASTLVNVFAGNETKKDSPYWKLYTGRATRTDSRWTDLAGAEVRVALAGAELRGVYITSKTQNRFVSEGDTEFGAPARQRIWGLSASYDESDWVGRAEWLYIDRRQDYGGDRASLLAVGRRFGPWLPMLSWSRYRLITLASDTPREGHDLTSLLLRREMDASSALKLQLDRWQDRATPGFDAPHGDRSVISVAYVRVF
jgi:hypothetical protein